MISAYSIAARGRLDPPWTSTTEAHPEKMFHEITGAGTALVDRPRRSSGRLEGDGVHPSGALADPILTTVHDNCLSGDKGGIVAC